MAHIPYGYRIIDGKAQIDQECAGNLKQFFRNYLSGQSIDEAGVAIPRGRTCLGKMLKNPVYLGDGYYPRIIDPEMFEIVQDERRKRYAAQGCPSTASPLKTVPIRTSFYMLNTKNIYADPVRQAEYVYGRIRCR